MRVAILTLGGALMVVGGCYSANDADELGATLDCAEGDTCPDGAACPETGACAEPEDGGCACAQGADPGLCATWQQVCEDAWHDGHHGFRRGDHDGRARDEEGRGRRHRRSDDERDPRWRDREGDGPRGERGDRDGLDREDRRRARCAQQTLRCNAGDSMSCLELARVCAAPGGADDPAEND